MWGISNQDAARAQTAVSTETKTVTLRSGAVGPLALLGQSVAGVGPSIGAAAFFPLAFAEAGAASWISVVLATVGVAAVGVCISYLARHHVSAGALYTYIPKGLRSSTVGFVSAGIAFVLGMCATVGALFGFGLYTAAFLDDANIVHLSTGGTIVVDIVGLTIAGLLAVRDIRVSTRVLLIIEAVSMAVISVLLLVVFTRHQGGAFDSGIAAGHGSNVHGIVLGAVFFILGFGGFESAAALSAEARNPRRSVPLAVLGSTAVVALFFVANAYVQVLGFQGTKESLADQAFPLTALAGLYHVQWLGTIVALGVAVSFFSAVNAYINYTARMAFAAARDRLLPTRLGRTHERTGAPHIAVVAFIVIAALAPVVVGLTGIDQETAFGDFSALAGYSFTLLYLLVSLAAIGWVVIQAARAIGLVAAGLLGAAAMGVEFYYSFVPFPSYPASLPLIIFLAALGVLVVGYVVVRLGSAELALRAGQRSTTPAAELVPTDD
jgi:amino acid transporter